MTFASLFIHIFISLCIKCYELNILTHERYYTLMNRLDLVIHLLVLLWSSFLTVIFHVILYSYSF
jgi:hypothetical protein